MGLEKECRWFSGVLISTIAILAGLSGLTVAVEPFFHYHKPLRILQYPLLWDNERYMNDGILKNFDYEAIITGTSMAENFKVSDFEALWKVKTVKTPFSGASYKEIADNLDRAFMSGKRIKYVLRSLDYFYLFGDKDAMMYEEDTYPWYLYDDVIWNDVKYILNKDVLFGHTLETIDYTIAGNETTSFDAYANWNGNCAFGKDAVLNTYVRLESAMEDAVPLTEEESGMIKASLEQNVLSMARKNPDTKFFLFFTPYSIVWWDAQNRSGVLKRRVEAEQLAIEEILEFDNIELYSFSNNFDLTCNLDNYKDIEHYGEEINHKILQWIYNGEYRLTKENYKDYISEIREFYLNYDYDSIFE